MSETYTSSNGLILPATGTDAGIWGNELNTNFGLIDTAVDGVESIALTTGTYNLNIADGTASSGRYKVVEFTGTPSGPVAVSVTPVNIQKVYWIVNSSSQSVILSNGTGSTLTIATLTTAPCFCDGNGNCIGLQAGNNNFTNLAIAGNLSVAGTSTLTGATTIGSTLGVSGATSITGLLTLLGGMTSTSGTQNFVGSTVDLPAGTSVNVNGTSLPTYIQNQSLPTLASVPASGGGNYIVATFGTVVGSRTQIAIGSGLAANGVTIPIPAGFSYSNMVISASLNSINTFNTSQPLCYLSIGISSNAMVCTGNDANGHTFNGTGWWNAVGFATGV